MRIISLCKFDKERTTRHSMEKFKKEFAEYLAKTFILSNAPKEVSDKLWIELNNLVLPNIPQKLFRFRGCSKYSFADFKNGKITTCVADRFPDEYDSMVYVNKEYIKNTIFSFYDAGGVQSLYDTKGSGEIYPIIEQQFGKELADKARIINESTPTEIQQRILDTSYWEQFTDELSILIDAHIENIRTNRFTKIACFTEDVQSQYMWDNYADGYSGFALEYDFRNLAFSGCEVCPKVKECEEHSKNFTSIYPVIYSETRYNATESIINLITNQLLQSITSTKDLLPVDLLHWYKAHLYKGQNGYAQEKEWRMLSHCPSAMDSDFTEIPDRQCIKAIYYGPKIKGKNKQRLHNIAKARGIEEYDVILDNNSPRFELRTIKV